MSTTALPIVAALMAIHSAMPPANAQAEGSMVCTSIGLEPPRNWRVEAVGATWRIVHWRGTHVDRAVSLAMPATARARLTKDTVDFEARTSNGGIEVSLTGSATDARLDVYVSYELEVNVDTSLTPAIDQLNTDGPIGVRCLPVER